MTPTLTIWLQLLGILALEIAVVAGLAFLLQRFTPSAAWRRTLWQAGIVAALLLVGVELTGVARHATAWRNAVSKPSRLESVQCAVLPDSTPLKDDFRAAVLARAVHPVKAAQWTTIDAARHDVTAGSSPSPHDEGVGRGQGRGVAFSRHSGGFPQKPVEFNQIQTPHIPISPRQTIDAETMSILVFVSVWTFGMALVACRAFFCRAFILVFRRKCRPVLDASLEESVHYLANSLGIRGGIRLVESGCFATPVAYGVIHPTVGLPLEFAKSFNRPQQEAILLHELAHLRASDPVWWLLADLMTAVLWWHPLSWWMRRRLHSASEAAADEASLLLADGPGHLAECLVTLGGRLTRRPPFASIGMAGSGFQSGLGRRVERLVALNGRAWSPPSPKRSALVRLAGAFILTVTSVLCIAWVVPPALNKGENMQTMQHTWKRSLAAFALLATLGNGHQPATAAEPLSPQVSLTADWVELTPIERLQKKRQAESLVADKTDVNPGGSITASGHVSVTTDVATVAGGPSSTATLESSGPTDSTRASGITSGGSGGATTALKTPASKQQQAVQSKLERITFDNVEFNALPLGEVIKSLMDVSVARDTDKTGVNFLVNREQPPMTQMAAVDPTTNLPVPAMPTESLDLNSVTINLSPRLKHVRLLDVLNAVVKVADHPIKYSIEDYGVIFSQDQKDIPIIPGNGLPYAPLAVRTFKVDTNTFFSGMEAAFGIKLASGGGPRAQEVQEALRNLLRQLDINLDARNKSIFYNQLTGILMVRGTEEDLAVVQAAVETLGGAVYSSSMAGGVPGNPAGMGYGISPGMPAR